MKELPKPVKWFDDELAKAKSNLQSELKNKLPDPQLPKGVAQPEAGSQELSENTAKSTFWWSPSNLENKPGAVPLVGSCDNSFTFNKPTILKEEKLYWATGGPIDPPSSPSKVGSWTSNGAKPVINWAQLASRIHGYHVCLGGSVLNNGKSEKDLDLYFLPMNADSPVDPVGMKSWIETALGKLEPIGNTYPGKELPYIYKGKLTCSFGFQPQRIDVFIMGTAEHEELLTAQAPVEVELGASNIEHFKKPVLESSPVASNLLPDEIDQQIEDAIFKKYNLDPNKPLPTIKEMYPDDDIPF